MSDAEIADDFKLVYRYDESPTLEIWRRSLGEGRYMHRIVQQNHLPGVVIIPTDGQSVLLIRQRRESIERDVWQFPRGFREAADADSADAAARELAEETGLAGAVRVLGPIWTDPGILSTSIMVAEIRANLGDAVESNDPDERIIEHRVVAMTELTAWIRDGTLSDGISLAAWALHSADAAVHPSVG